jgi:hypothetical protein
MTRTREVVAGARSLRARYTWESCVSVTRKRENDFRRARLATIEGVGPKPEIRLVYLS